jgi:hypothetical protein
MKHIIADVAFALLIAGIMGCMNNSKNNASIPNSIDSTNKLPLNRKDTPNKPDKTSHEATADSMSTKKIK